jgi:membrane protease YdiL (CAAX protease family)
MPEKLKTFPNGLEAFFLVAALLIAESFVGDALSDVRAFSSMKPDDLGAMIMLLGNGIIFTVVMHYKGLNYRDLFHSSPSSMAATLAVLLPAIVLTIPILLLTLSTLVAIVTAQFPMSRGEAAMFAEMTSGSFGAVVMVCILAPILEEMLFRGIILRSFLQQYSRGTAIIGSAALFGFAHLNLYQYIAAVVMGMFLGWLYERSKSLLPCIALHAAYNSACTFMEFSAPQDNQGYLGMFSSFAWLVALLLGAAGILMLRRVFLVPVNRSR